MPRLPSQRSVDQYFRPVEIDTDPYYDQVEISELPQLTRPIIEAIHDLRPDFVAANDRGGRFAGLCVFWGWRKRYPADSFPTIDNRIQFVRVTRKSRPEDVQANIMHALGRSGIDEVYIKTAENPPKVLFIDDWTIYGKTAERCFEATRNQGIPDSSVTYATLVGSKLGQMKNHIVGNNERTTDRAEWEDYFGDSKLIGVRFDGALRVNPVGMPSPSSREARLRLRDALDRYYEDFTSALRLGNVAACACIK